MLLAILLGLLLGAALGFLLFHSALDRLLRFLTGRGINGQP